MKIRIDRCPSSAIQKYVPITDFIWSGSDQLPLKLNRIDEKSTYMLKRILFRVESCLDIFDCTIIQCIMNKIVTLGVFRR